MNELDYLPGSRAKPHNSPFWPQIAMTAASMIAAVVGSQVAGYEWLIYVGFTLLIISMLLILFESRIGKSCKITFLKQKDKMYLSRKVKAYQGHIEALRICIKFEKEVHDLPWGNKRPPQYFGLYNSYNHITAKDTIGLLDPCSRLMYQNALLSNLTSIADSYFQVCDNYFRSGDIRYPNELKQNSVLRILRAYENAVAAHNTFCREVNENLKTTYLKSICDHELGFNWSKSLPEEKPEEIVPG